MKIEVKITDPQGYFKSLDQDFEIRNNQTAVCERSGDVAKALSMGRLQLVSIVEENTVEATTEPSKVIVEEVNPDALLKEEEEVTFPSNKPRKRTTKTNK